MHLNLISEKPVQRCLLTSVIKHTLEVRLMGLEAVLEDSSVQSSSHHFSASCSHAVVDIDFIAAT